MDVFRAAFGMLGYAVSARAVFLLTLLGAFALGVLAMRSLTPMALAVLVAYCAFTVIPAAYLEVKRGRG